MSLVKLSIKRNFIQPNTKWSLCLIEVDGERKLPIVIGAFEAQSIAIALEKKLNHLVVTIYSKPQNDLTSL
jgi:bifunctional DNase/RNase